ncbi:MAG TPA: hypothetical protein VFM07_03085 [Intrasporangium sp.]|nr:hypothetical protein [Intrasporangium sp.]
MDAGGTSTTAPPRSEVRPGATVSRRAVVAGLFASAGLLAGCGLRLDLPQPAPPTPTRQQVPDETLLVGFVRDLRDVVAVGEQLPKADQSREQVKEALRVLRDQASVLTGRLTNEGVPMAAIDGGPPTSAAGSATSGPPSGLTRFRSALALLPSDRWQSLATASPTSRPVLLSATSARLAAAVRLGASVPIPQAGPQAVHKALVERTAPLVYGFEVVAAQSDGAARKTALATLDALRLLLAEVGPVVPGPALPGGWQLPYAVTRPEAAARLAHDVLVRAIDGTTTILPVSPPAPALAEVAAWSARVQALGAAHGIPLMAFPGTSGTARP